jgi:signal transduction histidine kinase
MNDVAREMATITRRLLGPDITLILELKSAEALARVDRSNAEQVVMNLLMNARDAITGSGSIYLTVAANRGGSRYTLLRVRDTGSGMTPEVQQRMFEPFFTTKGGKGTGLGLSTVYGIVTQAGGTLDVKTAVGVGTTIDVLLPGE